MQQNVSVWFEIPATDFERAVGFYEKTLQTTLRREVIAGSKLAVFPHADGTPSGCIIAGEGYKPNRDGAVVYLSSPTDLEQPLARAKSAGGKVATPKTALPPGMGFFAHFLDSEGNRVGLHSME